MDTTNHPTYTLTLHRFQLDRDNCDNIINTDADYVLVDQRYWLDYICPLINADAESYRALRTLGYSGPHAVAVS
jgi:hypothetical protein